MECMSQIDMSAGRSRVQVWALSVLPRIASRLESEVLRYAAHAATFGVIRGASVLMATRVRHKLAGRRVTVKLPGTDVRLTVRLRSSDVNVFYEIFGNQEYGWAFNVAPRVIVDVGGYTGLSAAYFAVRYPDATIVAIEPDAENFELLKLNTASFPNVYAVNAAVWRESGTVSLNDPGHGAWGLQVTGQSGPTRSVTSDSAHPAGEFMRAVTIDEIIKEFNLERIDLLKVDVEGSEIEIFATADSWISMVDTICIELHDRFKSGCSRAFFDAVEQFPIEMRRNEDVLVARAGSLVAPARQGD
jgi:FkbM family methyltransferase